jgi:hypothetical protein
MGLIVRALRGKRVVLALLSLGIAGLNAAVLLLGQAHLSDSNTGGSSHAPPPAQINTPRGTTITDDDRSPKRDSLLGQRLILSTTRLDLGDGKPNEIVRGELTLSNPHDSPVVFSLVKHCGCTELSPLSGTLAAGGKETIHVGIQLPDHANSEKNTSVEVQIGTPPMAVARCVLSARCSAPFNVTPSHIDFGSLTEEEAAPAFRELTVEKAEGQPAFDPGAFILDHAGDQFRIDGPGPAGHGSFIVRVSLMEGAAQGDHYDTLELRPRGSDYFVRVPLHVKVVAPITVVPGTVLLRAGLDQRAFQSVPLLVMGRQAGEPLGEVTLAHGPPGVRIEDLGPANENRRRARVLFGSEAAGWQKETRIWPRSGKGGRRFGLKFVKSS